MKVTREQVAQNRRRILDAASRLFRGKGFDDVTVAEVMRSAGLTHGAFYGHFASKDDLIAQTLAHCLAAGSDEQFELQAYVSHYLSAEHRDNPGEGCPFAALASHVRHQSHEARSTMSSGACDLIGRIESEMPSPGSSAQTASAIGNWAAMVGAMILARAVDDPELSDRILQATRDFVTVSLTRADAQEPMPASLSVPAASIMPG